ncbi:hypothetical protein FMUAM8_35910 [Nocardia cyriacigeorgica]|uniref:Daunorubicin/doxorubicin resistance ATP-binding protein DrrA n=1 Tax=Nocardia cyriacigeorgica (strain GUH-2) TaxID=1127134 RepID=H6R0A4_NOCCG|nr:hypothetical protein FMUAM8_35910 [Nocardia cyriacigeorgica]CCF64172.1 protein of unknown function [Nocardia cyriacigeorgica GUH-2]
MSAAIDISQLVKTFGRTRALDGLDLQVATGEVHGFLGPNGAGNPPPSGCCWGCCAPTAAPRRCSAATRGSTAPNCTGDWRMCPAM